MEESKRFKRKALESEARDHILERLVLVIIEPAIVLAKRNLNDRDREVYSLPLPDIQVLGIYIFLFPVFFGCVFLLLRPRPTFVVLVL